MAAFITLLIGCSDFEKEQLKNQNSQLSFKVTQLEKQVQEQATELQNHKIAAEREWQKEQLFLENLDAAAACRAVFELPFVCPPTLSEARAKVLAEANQKGISVIKGARYWLTVTLSASAVLLIFMAGMAGFIGLLSPARDRLKEAQDTIQHATDEAQTIKENGLAHKAALADELASVEQQIRQRRQELADIEEQIHLAENDLDAAQQATEQAEAQTLKEKQHLDMLKAFKKGT